MQATTNDVAAHFLRVVPQVMRVIAADVRRSGLDIEPLHIHLLGIISQRDWNLGELADVLSVSAPTMSKTISTLESRGWVRRERSEGDRRIVLVRLTPKGTAVLAEAREYMIDRIAEALEPLTEEQFERLTAGLDILGEAFAHAFPSD